MHKELVYALECLRVGVWWPPWDPFCFDRITYD